MAKVMEWGSTPERARAILADFNFHLAHEEQLPPDGDWRAWLFMGGRGSGKTRAGAEWVNAEVREGRARRVALIGPTLGDVREVMIGGPSGLRTISREGEQPDYEVSRRRLVWPNGAEGFAFSAEDADSLRGPQFDAAWCDEIGAWAQGEDVWDMLMFALRLGEQPRVVATTTPRACALVRRLLREAEAGRVALSRARTADNAAHLAPGFVAALEEAYAGTRLARQEMDGELVEDPPGAMWTRGMIEGARVRAGADPHPATRADGSGAAGLPLSGGGGRPSVPAVESGEIGMGFPPPARGRDMGEAGGIGAAQVGVSLDRVVVAVDPPASSGAKADACGIVVAGKRGAIVYVLQDASCRGLRPLEWAERVVRTAKAWGAGEIVAEANQGGEMVRAVLETAGAEVRVRLRHARASKRDRAEPVSMRYERGLVKHAGVFRELEDEMCAFGAEAGRSPDRVDALVWAVTALTEPPPVPPSVLGL